MRHRPFTDTAGYKRHCWECVHAKCWVQITTIGGWTAICDIDGSTVHKHSSSNNPCLHTGVRCNYETEVFA